MKRYIKCSITYHCVVHMEDSITGDVKIVERDTTAISESKAKNNAKFYARNYYPGYTITNVSAYIVNATPDEILPKHPTDSDRQKFCPNCDVPLLEDDYCPECGEFAYTLEY